MIHNFWCHKSEIRWHDGEKKYQKIILGDAIKWFSIFNVASCCEKLKKMLSVWIKFLEASMNAYDVI